MKKLFYNTKKWKENKRKNKKKHGKPTKKKHTQSDKSKKKKTKMFVSTKTNALAEKLLKKEKGTVKWGHCKTMVKVEYYFGF